LKIESLTLHFLHFQKAITWEDVVKVKAFTDMVMHQYYKPFWEEEMEKRTKKT